MARYVEFTPDVTEEPNNFIQLYTYLLKGEMLSLDVDITGKAMFKKITVDGVEVSIDELDEAKGKYYQLGEGEDFTFNSNTFKTHIVEFEAINPNLLGGEVSMVEDEVKVEDFGPTFAMCLGIIDITIPNTVTNIGQYAFYYAPLISVNIPSTVTNIGENAFEGISTQSIYIPGSVKTIGDHAFHRVSFFDNGKITLEEGIQEIGEYAISRTNITEITIPNSVTNIGDFAFYRNEQLTTVTLPETLEVINEGVFSSCINLTDITLPPTIKRINTGAFDNCTSLTEITLPNSITTIGHGVFHNCTSLVKVIILATTPPTLIGEPISETTYDYENFYNNAEGRKFYVPAESLEAYKAAEGWSTYASDIYPIE